MTQGGFGIHSAIKIMICDSKINRAVSAGVNPCGRFRYTYLKLIIGNLDIKAIIAALGFKAEGIIGRGKIKITENKLFIPIIIPQFHPSGAFRRYQLEPSQSLLTFQYFERQIGRQV